MLKHISCMHFSRKKMASYGVMAALSSDINVYIVVKIPVWVYGNVSLNAVHFIHIHHYFDARIKWYILY